MLNKFLALANFVCVLLLLFGQYWATFVFVGLALYLMVMGLGRGGIIFAASMMNFCCTGMVMVVSMVAMAEPKVSHPETTAFILPALTASVMLLIGYIIESDKEEKDTDTLR